MAMIRPELSERLWQGRELIAGLAVGLAGGWLASGGGYVLAPVGLGLAALGVGWALQAWRRLRFQAPGEAPGVVEVDEGQVSYFGPQTGGAVALPDLVELRLVSLRGRRLWRLKQADGQALLIPVEAAGAERLFDAFSSLPGLDSATLVEALHPAPAASGTGLAATGEMRLVWQRRGPGILRP